MGHNVEFANFTVMIVEDQAATDFSEKVVLIQIIY